MPRIKTIFNVFLISLLMITVVPMMMNNSIVSATIPNPTVTTNTSININCTTAVLSGYVVDNGSSENAYQYFQYGKTTSYGNYTLADPIPGDYIIAGGGNLFPPRTAKEYWRSNLTLKQQSIEFGDYLTTLTSDYKYLYVGSSATGMLSQFWLNNMTRKGNTTGSYVGSTLQIVNDYLYIYRCLQNGTVDAFYKSNLSHVYWNDSTHPGVKRSTVQIGGGGLYGLCIDYTYIYAVGYNGYITRIWKSNFTIKDNTTLPTPTEHHYVVCRDNTYLYTGGSSHRVYQYWLNVSTNSRNMSFKKKTIDLGSDVTVLSTGGNGTYLYVGAGNNVYQFWARNMTLRRTVSYGGIVRCLTCDYTYVYAGGEDMHTVNQYWMSNMTLKNSVNYGRDVFSLNVPPKYGPAFHVAISELFPGFSYHYVAVIDNTNSTGTGSDKTVLTRPFPPVNDSYFILRRIYGYGVNITWTKGLGANNTVIRVSNTGYPQTYTSGSPVCNITGTTYNHTIAVPVIYWYYSAWSYSKWGKDHLYSPNATRGMIIMWENPIILDAPVSVSQSGSIMNIVMNLTNMSYDTYSNLGFQYGKTGSFGSTSTIRNVSSIGDYTLTQNGFEPDTTYYFKLQAGNHNGTSYGTMFTFKTAPDSSYYLVSTILPILIAVAVMGLIVGLIFTMGATKESLITIMLVTILAVILIQVILGL